MPSYGSIPTITKDNGDGALESESTPLMKPPSTAVDEPFFAASPTDDNKTDRSLWSRLTFQWFTTILHRGNENNRLELEDLELIPLPADCSCDEVLKTFDHYWQLELAKKSPSLVMAFVRAFGKEYLYAAFLKFIHDLSIFVGPQVLHAMIVFLRTPDAPLWHGLGLTAAVTISQIAVSFCLRHYFFKCYQTGLRIRTAIVLAVYRKALVLSAAERQTKTLGEITNLVSIDATRLQDLMNYVMSLWSSPLQSTLCVRERCDSLSKEHFCSLSVSHLCRCCTAPFSCCQSPYPCSFSGVNWELRPWVVLRSFWVWFPSLNRLPSTWEDCKRS